MSERTRYRTIVISDVHLGNRHAKVREVTDFLSSVDCERLILNGDIIDGWQLRKSGDRTWKPEYRTVEDNDEDDGEFRDGNHICNGKSR